MNITGSTTSSTSSDALALKTVSLLPPSRSTSVEGDGITAASNTESSKPMSSLLTSRVSKLSTKPSNLLKLNANAAGK